jgi:hypothetical protein
MLHLLSLSRNTLSILNVVLQSVNCWFRRKWSILKPLSTFGKIYTWILSCRICDNEHLLCYSSLRTHGQQIYFSFSHRLCVWITFIRWCYKAKHIDSPTGNELWNSEKLVSDLGAILKWVLSLSLSYILATRYHSFKNVRKYNRIYVFKEEWIVMV